ncbi:hypothetical protein [Actinomadura sp. WMMB 499]|uniref:hypothetical protein n=1 Tax=Actinomadura sp. WMMB 499 TaxID=1219491 RepID=UPI0012475414|nr:hypothetical protein [Actinomadura sp. WMMB 499]QFG23546.1 hypothetical protein F7P10_22920 [Actinomadura sp. WMMB 499]
MTRSARPPRRDGIEAPETFAAVMVLTLSLVLLWVTPKPGSLERLPDPPSGPEHVAAGPVAGTVPAGCAVSAATIERLVPRPRLRDDGGGGTCEWSSDGGERRLRLTVEVNLASGRTVAGYPELSPGRSPVSAAMASFAPKWTDAPARVVTGLGEEAFAQFAPSQGALVVARSGNAEVAVRYHESFTPLPEEEARSGALAAAAEVLAGLGAPASAALAPAPRATPARTIPDPCASVSGVTLNRLVQGDDVVGTSARVNAVAVTEADAEQRGCNWMSEEHRLRAGVTVLPGTKLFDGTRQAVREYAVRYLDARAEETLSVHDEKRFHPVTGLGDEAFAVHVPGVVPATIVFRDGNLLAGVTYTEADERRPLDGRLALRGAYAAAQDLAEAVSGD